MIKEDERFRFILEVIQQWWKRERAPFERESLQGYIESAPMFLFCGGLKLGPRACLDQLKKCLNRSNMLGFNFLLHLDWLNMKS